MPLIIHRQPSGWAGLIFQAYRSVFLSTDAALVIYGHDLVEIDDVTFADDFCQVVTIPVKLIAVITDVGENRSSPPPCSSACPKVASKRQSISWHIRVPISVIRA
jgi:hypothetical protein